jgi:hypothetical protein
MSAQRCVPMEEVLLSRDALFLLAADGISPDLVRAGEPRLRRSTSRATTATEPVRSTSRAPRLRRALRVVTP